MLAASQAAAQDAPSLTEWRSYLRASVPLTGPWSADVHLTEYGNNQRQALDEVKTGAGIGYAVGAWRLSSGYEHVVVPGPGPRRTEERVLLAATATHRFADWLTARDLQETEVRDMYTAWTSRWINQVRADVGGAAIPFVTPWVGREWAYDARLGEANKSMWLYGLRLRTRAPVQTEVFFYDEYDTARAVHRLSAVALSLSYSR